MVIKARDRRNPNRKNILILLWSSTISSGRDFLAGFAKLARHRHDWRLHLRISKKTLEPNILRTIRFGGYKAIEGGVVGGYKKIEDAFVGKFLTKEGESVEDAKKRLGGRA